MAYNLASSPELRPLGQAVAIPATPVTTPVHLAQEAVLRLDQRRDPQASSGYQGMPPRARVVAKPPLKQGATPMTPAARDAYLTTPQAADYLKCTPRWLERLRQMGGGPTYAKLSKRKVLYAKADLDAWVAGSRCQHTSEEQRF